MLRLASFAVVVVAFSSAGCSEKIEEKVAPLGGSCLGCHGGITDVHPYFALACVDCHGGNDQLTLPARFDPRDGDIMKLSHVLPRDPRMWFPNGIDDDGDGLTDETAAEDAGGVAEFFDATALNDASDEALAKARQAQRFEPDSEINRDVNYLRFINPGDLRVAEVSCGGRNRNANAAMVCHAETVYDVRRSIMATNSGVAAGALYGNAQRPRAFEYGTAFAGSAAGALFDARNPRIGRAGYAFDYDAIDESYDTGANAFDHDAIAKAAAADCNEDAKRNCDPEDDTFEALAGPIFDDGTAKDPFGNFLDPGRGLTRTGNPLQFFDAPPEDNRAIDALQYVGNRANRTFPPPGSAIERRLQKIIGSNASPIVNGFDGRPISNPVDAALRVFRAYHVLNFVSPSDNFPPDPGNATFSSTHVHNNHNPFGRFLSSGCTACHVEYAKDGHNVEPVDRTVADNGRNPSTALPDGILDGQRAYAKLHKITTAVKLETCASCHGFVTRVDYAVEGKFELETDFTNVEVGSDGKPNFNNVQKLATTFTTPKGTVVNLFENLADFDEGVLVNSGESVNEDANGNGELDEGEDLNGNGQLDIPDRVNRSDSFDGRQSKLVYGGANGSTHLTDVHIDAGFACSDCHVTSVHGDSNLYTRNWDAEPVECEDCHGTPQTPATLVSSGPNGGDAFDDPRWNTPFGKPWLERTRAGIVEHSRTIAGKSWVVPQLHDERQGDARTGYARYIHTQPAETIDRPGEERALAHIQEAGKKGGLECYSCHSSWQPNCFTCHLRMDVNTPKQEIWWGDDDTENVFFQLFSYTRSPFYMGRAGDVEGNRIAPYRSTMQVHVTLHAGPTTLLESAVLATEDHLSSSVSNPYFPHTVRTVETKTCARCHTLVDANGNVENDTFVTEATGQGSGRYMNLGDFAMVATTAGLQVIDVKKEAAGLSFPGFDFADTNPSTAALALAGATDVVLLRGVAFTDGSSDIADVAIVAHAAGVSVVDVTGRTNAGLPPTELARLDLGTAALSVDVVDAAASQTKRFVVATAAELCTVDFAAALAPATARAILDGAAPVAPTIVGGACVPHGKTGVTKVRLHGRFALLAHGGGVTAYELDDANRTAAVDVGAPLAERDTFASAQPVLDVASSGRFAYAAEGAGGVEAFDIGPLVYPLHAQFTADPVPVDTNPVGAVLAGADSRGVAVYGSKILVADGVNGLRIVDASVPADMQVEQTILNVANGAPLNQATAVAVATEPTRTFAVVADGANGLRAVNITSPVDVRAQIAAAAANPAGFRGFRLSPERWDPLTPFDPRNTTPTAFTYATNGAALSVARGLMFDGIADKSGRQLRDSWSIGAAALDEETVGRIRSVVVKEVPNTFDTRGDGLGCVVRDGDEGAAIDPNDPNRCLP